MRCWRCALPQAASADEKTFSVADYCGPSICAQIWNVPRHVTSATFDVYGGEGAGSIYFPGVRGGLGGRATATIDVKPGQQYTIYVGRAGRLVDNQSFETESGRAVWSSSASDGSSGPAAVAADRPHPALPAAPAAEASWGPPGTKFEAGVHDG